MITDHAFIPGVGNFCVHTTLAKIATGVTVRNPCLQPKESHER